MSDTLRFSAPVQTAFIEEGYDPAYFVALTGGIAKQAMAHELIRRLELGKRRGFGSIKVAARIGGSDWKTSLFPRKAEDGRSDGWFLPIKKPVRLAEGLAEGDEVAVELTLL